MIQKNQKLLFYVMALNALNNFTYYQNEWETLIAVGKPNISVNEYNKTEIL